MECLFCARHCANGWGHSGEQDRWCLASRELTVQCKACVLVESCYLLLLSIRNQTGRYHPLSPQEAGSLARSTESPARITCAEGSHIYDKHTRLSPSQTPRQPQCGNGLGPKVMSHLWGFLQKTLTRSAHSFHPKLGQAG